jgi:hypothetical protein
MIATPAVERIQVAVSAVGRSLAETEQVAVVEH